MAASFMVGDGITDVIAGRDAGAKTILVNVRKCYLCEEMAKHDAIPDFFATNLLAAVDTIREQLKTTVGM
jgi:phosphoglycolate phosphatase-like HAD superfamily hydrolase